MIKLLLLDADGVLTNAEMFSRQLQRDYGIPFTKLDPFFEKEFSECLVGKADLKEAIKPYLAGWGWQGSVDELLDYWFKAEHKIDERLIEYVQNLRKKGVSCVVATNQEKHRAQYMLDKMGFAQAFDGLFASAHLGRKKPDSEFFSELHKHFNSIDKSEILFWDDNEAPVSAAREYGIHAERYFNFDDFVTRMTEYI